MKKLLLVLSFTILFSCKEKKEETIFDKISELKDSVSVENITIKNLFKHQVLAHKNGYDSTRIKEKVYKAHSELWEMYSMIMDEKAFSEKGVIKWNKTYYLENKQFIDTRIEEFLSLNTDSLFKSQLTGFKKVVPYPVPNAKISVVFPIYTGVGFGGMDVNSFCFELNNEDFPVKETLKFGIPHELNHFVYEQFSEERKSENIALEQVVDEGFACYFTYLLMDGKLSKKQAVEFMNEDDWKWYETNEKKIFEKSKPYFKDSSEKNPLVNHKIRKEQFPDAPKSIAYWLGFKIIESYVEENGKDSWKDIYKMNAKDVLKKSKYEEKLNRP